MQLVVHGSHILVVGTGEGRDRLYSTAATPNEPQADFKALQTRSVLALVDRYQPEMAAVTVRPFAVCTHVPVVQHAISACL
jgi:hypothetical protein